MGSKKKEENIEGQIDTKSPGNTQVIMGIILISSIVNDVLSGNPNPEQIAIAMDQILYYAEALPKDWKKKAYYLFSRLWDRKRVFISTRPELGDNIYGESFDDTRIEKLYRVLPQKEAALLVLGNTFSKMLKRGLHHQYKEQKEETEAKYGSWGAKIVNLVTTGDIQYMLDELGDNYSKDTALKKFNEWVDNYQDISILVSPSDFEQEKAIRNRIITAATNLKKSFLLLHVSGTYRDVTKLVPLVEDMERNDLLNYSDLIPSLSKSGFCHSLKIELKFD